MTDLKDMSIDELFSSALSLDTKEVGAECCYSPNVCVSPEVLHEAMRRFRELELELAAKNLEIEADDRNVNALMDQVHELSNNLAAKDAECEELRAQMDQYPPT